MNPTRIVTLSIVAFAVVGILAVGLGGGDWSGDSDETAAIETLAEVTDAEAPARDERTPSPDSESDAADDEAREEWVEGPASDSEGAGSADEGEEIESIPEVIDAAEPDRSGGDEEPGEDGPFSE